MTVVKSAGVRHILALSLSAAVSSVAPACGARGPLDPNLRSSATITRSRRGAAPRSAPAADSGDEVEGRSPPPEAGGPNGWWSRYETAEAIATFEGRASYYADRFEGRSTASGEPYRASERTAASRDLAFGTILRVTRADTGESVIVRVNDRGPFGDRSRVLDLSRSAAEALDMIRRGVIDVRVEILERSE